MLVTRTGGGKSHVFRMLGTLLRGVHLIIHPLLVLAADQMQKFGEGSFDFGTVACVNVDNAVKDHTRRTDLLTRLAALRRSTSSTVYLFASPQCLVQYPAVRQTLLACAERGTLRFCTLNECHLLGKHVATFRPKK